MDQTAFSMCAENGMPLIVFNMNREGNLMAVAKGNRCGTVINL